MEVEKAIIRALKNIGMPSDIIPILADRDGVEPRAPFLIIQTISTTKIGTPTRGVTHKEGNVVETLYQLKEFDYALTFHASTSGDTHDWVQYFSDGLSSDLLDWAFVQEGLGIVHAGEVMYQPSPVQGVNYKRAILNITFRSEVSNEYVVNNFSGIGVSGSAIDPIAGKIGEINVDIDFNEKEK